MSGSFLSDLRYNDSTYRWEITGEKFLPVHFSIFPIALPLVNSSYEDTEVSDGDQVEYLCFNGMKSAKVFDFQSQSAKCVLGTDGFVWETPLGGWEMCTESEYYSHTTYSCKIPFNQHYLQNHITRF